MIADSGATPDFVASDLLSQAEHGPDSQVILLTPDTDMAHQVAEAVERQLAELPACRNRPPGTQRQPPDRD